jgi:hypothetical protein
MLRRDDQKSSPSRKASARKPAILLQRGRIEGNWKRSQHDRLMLLPPPERLLGPELLAADPQVLHQKPTLLLPLPSDLLRLAIEIDENVHLRLEDQGLDRLEDVVDGSRSVAAEHVQVVLVERRQEQDRHPRRARTAADEPCDLVPVDARHLYVEENDRKVVPQDVPQSRFAAICGHDLDAGRAQHLLDGEEIARIVIDRQNLGGDEIRSGTSQSRARDVRSRLGRSEVFGHGRSPSSVAPFDLVSKLPAS